MADLKKDEAVKPTQTVEKERGTLAKIGSVFFDFKSYKTMLGYVFDVRRPARLIARGYKVMTTNTVKTHGKPLQFFSEEERNIVSSRLTISGFSLLVTGVFVALFCVMSAKHNIAWAWFAPIALAAFIWMATMKFWQASIVKAGKTKTLGQFLTGKE